MPMRASSSPITRRYYERDASHRHLDGQPAPRLAPRARPPRADRPPRAPRVLPLAAAALGLQADARRPALPARRESLRQARAGAGAREAAGRGDDLAATE